MFKDLGFQGVLPREGFGFPLLADGGSLMLCHLHEVYHKVHPVTARAHHKEAEEEAQSQTGTEGKRRRALLCSWT